MILNLKKIAEKNLKYTVTLHILRNSAALLKIVNSLKYFVIKLFAVYYKGLASTQNILCIACLYNLVYCFICCLKINYVINKR